MIPGVCAMLLAHFLTYAHVWEHHMSAVLVLAAKSRRRDFSGKSKIA